MRRPVLAEPRDHLHRAERAERPRPPRGALEARLQAPAEVDRQRRPVGLQRAGVDAQAVAADRAVATISVRSNPSGSDASVTIAQVHARRGTRPRSRRRSSPAPAKRQ